MIINEVGPTKVKNLLRGSMSTTSSGSSEDDSSLNPDALPPLAMLSTEDYAYRGEGNANIVIALPQEHKVIRFRKSLPEEVSPDGGKLCVEREVEFVRNVVSCFLGSYAQIPEILRFDSRDVARLSEAIRTLRPDERRHKVITAVYATMFPDYAFLGARLEANLFRNKSTFCVEIKPKQGFLGKSEHRFLKCPYCMTQYDKLKKKMIAARSAYCPFDLFSGEPRRVKSALRGLLESPQNNLKIFKDGIVVYDHESSSSDLERVLAEWFRNYAPSTKEGGYIDQFCDLVRAALLWPFTEERSKSSAYQAYSFLLSTRQGASKSKPLINPEVVAKAKKLLYFAGEECNFESTSLPKGSVLERILRMQMLPFIGTEYIYNTYANLSSFVTDDLIYSDFTPQDLDSSRETYLRIRAKDASIGRRSKLGSVQQGNKHINLESSWAAIEDTTNIESDPLATKASRSPMYLEQKKSLIHKSHIACDEENIDCNEQKMNCLIGIESLLAIQNYLLFTNARDCSILMSFRELDPSTTPSVSTASNVIKLSNECSFLCNIGVSDLDPKSVRCIEKHAKRDLRVLNSVITVLEEELTFQNQSSMEK